MKTFLILLALCGAANAEPVSISDRLTETQRAFNLAQDKEQAARQKEVEALAAVQAASAIYLAARADRKNAHEQTSVAYEEFASAYKAAADAEEAAKKINNFRWSNFRNSDAKDR